MLPRCREFQLRWLERATLVDAVDDDVSAHSLGCPDCTAFVRRATQLQRAWGELERQTVPDELPGRVVAACNAGYLQDRAAALLGAIIRVDAPEVLDRQVLKDASSRLRAPQVLERLLEEDLRDPSLAAGRRLAGRLDRLEAPDELFGRVQRELERPVAAEENRRERSQALRWSIVGLVAVIGLALGLRYGLREVTAAPAITFQVQRVHDASELDGLARDLAGGLTGGWSEVQWGEPR